MKCTTFWFSIMKTADQVINIVTSSGSDNLDRLRSPSAGNLSQQQQQYQPPQPPEPSNYNRQGIDPRSKSTSNLHVDTSFERNDPHANMRGAASVSMLHPGVSGYPQYSPAGRRPDIRPNDYENQPQVGWVGGGKC